MPAPQHHEIPPVCSQCQKFSEILILTSYDVFLSYNSKDSKYVKGLHDVLQLFGLNIWFDQDNLVGRGGLSLELQKAMSNSAIMVAVLGKHGLGPWQEQFELSSAFLNIVQGSKPFVLLLMPELSPELINNQWQQRVEVPLRDVFKDHLFIPLPQLRVLQRLGSDGRPHKFAERIVKLLTDAIRSSGKN